MLCVLGNVPMERLLIWLHKLHLCMNGYLEGWVELTQSIHSWETHPDGVPHLRVHHRAFPYVGD